MCPGIPNTIKTMGANITTIAYLKVLIIGIGSTINLMVVETQGVFSSAYGGVFRWQLHAQNDFSGVRTSFFCGQKLEQKKCKFNYI